jgi:ZIP family zinc transporter/zinc and cadmium transporter
MSALTTSLLLGATAAAANALGGYIIVRSAWGKHYLKYFIALGSGFMLATAFAEMLPESFELAPATAALWVLAGYMLVHLFEHTLTPHFHFGEEVHEHEFRARHKSYSVLFGLMIHTFFDGIAIASGFVVSQRLGWLIFLAVFLHKIPEGFTVASVMLAGGHHRMTAWGASAMLGAATLAGVLTLGMFDQLVQVALPLATGVTIYVAASDLIPEVNDEPGVSMALLVFLGAGLLFVFDALFHF